MGTIWFSGVCDTLLARIVVWHEKYTDGTIYATRKHLTETFEQEDKPVQYLHNIPFSLLELTNLVRIVTAEKPKWTITADFTRSLALLRNPRARAAVPKMVTSGPNGMIIIALVFEKKESREIREVTLPPPNVSLSELL